MNFVLLHTHLHRFQVPVAATQFGSVNLPLKEVLIAYCLPRNSWKSQTLTVADPGFGKGGFMRMCRVATTAPFDVHIHAHRCNESGCCCFNGL